MQNKNYVIFDLDGTLSDPGEGIINSLRLALKHFNIEANPETLRRFIGPPLTESFPKYYDFDEEKTQEAIKLYRKYFSNGGNFQNTIYPGISQLLQDLTEQGKILAIATTKPTVFAKEVLKHFEIDHFFKEELVIGSFLDGKRTNKAELITTVLELLKPDLDATVMVGDREYDILGAKANNIESIGVTYGYGDQEELQKAGATKIVDSVTALSESLLGK